MKQTVPQVVLDHHSTSKAKTMKKLIFIWICNLIDTVSTLILIRTGMFVEVNPLMALLLQNPFLFVLVKISVMTIVLLYLWKQKEHKKAQFVMNVGCWIYGLLAFYYTIIGILYQTIC